MGHNLGLRHANYLDCSAKPIASSGCTEVEYGDHSSAMGYGGAPFNAPERHSRGWLDASQIQAVSVDGTYRAAAGLSVKQLSHDDSGATVSVRFAPVTCWSNGPVLSVDKAVAYASPGGLAPKGVAYNVLRIRNDSGSICRRARQRAHSARWAASRRRSGRWRSTRPA
jgi:hypothetical protein